MKKSAYTGRQCLKRSAKTTKYILWEKEGIVKGWKG